MSDNNQMVVYKNTKNYKEVSFSEIKSPIDIPPLIEVQFESYVRFLQSGVLPNKRIDEGLQGIFNEFFPIYGANKEVVLEFVEYSLEMPTRTPYECKLKRLSYSCFFKAVIRLVIVETGEVREQEVYMGDVPMITNTGTFVINGIERVVVNQLHRSPGIFVFYDTIKNIYLARIIPDQKGSWLEFEVDARGVIYAKIDRRKKFYFTILLKALGYGSNEEVLRLFYEGEFITVKGTHLKTLSKYLGRRVIADVISPETGEVVLEVGESLNEDNLDIIKEAKVEKIELIVNLSHIDDTLVIQSLEKDRVSSQEEALIEFLKIQRPVDYTEPAGDPERIALNIEKANAELDRLFFNPKTYNMGGVGRYKINSKFESFEPKNFNDNVEVQVLRVEDIVMTIKYLIYVINDVDGYSLDDIDHLANRRVRSVGELVNMQLKLGFSRLERVVKERMTMNDKDLMTPQLLISIKSITATINEFFGTSQLSQFMDQTNPLSEITHKRRLNALGPSGLVRERAGFEVRDVHYTHYGRLCPIETPEGPSIGLIASLATYAKVNKYGFIESPYRVVKNGKVFSNVEYLSAAKEDRYPIAQANSVLTPKMEFQDNLVSCRYQSDFPLKNPKEVEYMDVSPLQVVSLSTGLIPFLEHDDANRALMGSNMQRQAVPLLIPEAPYVQTGLESVIGYSCGTCLLSRHDGMVVDFNGKSIFIKEKKTNEIHEYPLSKFQRSNQGTVINHQSLVNVYFAPEQGEITKITKEDVLFKAVSGMEYKYSLKTIQGEIELVVKEKKKLNQGDLIGGEKVRSAKIGKTSAETIKATVLADGQSTDHSKLSLGKNVLVAFMPWEGYNFEDAIIVSDRLVEDDVFTSIHIEEFEIQVRETKLGREMITRDIPNISERAFRDLDEEGIITIGSEVKPGDILVGVVTPKADSDLSPEYRLLHSIFGEKAKEVKDSSLIVPNGHEGIVVDIHRFSRDNRDELQPGVNESVKVFIAKRRRIAVGDKMAGRHGNKGVISTIALQGDMPFLSDGTSVDIILNPLGVPSRMNLGQIFETQLGWAAKALNIQFETPVFDGAKLSDIQKYMEEGGLPSDSKTELRDGKTGEAFKQKVFVGVIYMLKLSHMIEDKIHARSIGPYSLVTQQPLGGKSQFGGQRMGEMEVWALEAYGVAYTLQELLTVKSDDMLGRAKVYESIVKGIYIIHFGVPESFNVLMKEILSLALDMSVIDNNNEIVNLNEMSESFYKEQKKLNLVKLP